MKPAMLYARNIFGNTVFEGFAYDGDDWKSYGFRVDKNGNPISDQNGNTIASFDAEPFNPSDKNHAISALNFVCSDGNKDRDSLEEFLIDELGIDPELIKEELDCWCE